MSRRKIIIRSIALILLVALGFGAWYAWRAFPIISGYGAKNLCSAVYLQHRDPKDVLKEDLGEFPLSIGSFTVNREDSSVTGSVFGLAKRKAIFRKGVGCTLLNDLDEEEVRAQRFDIVEPPGIGTDTVDWPMGDRLPDTVPAGIDKSALDRILDSAIRETNAEGRLAYTRAVLVLYDGQIIGERYADGYDKNTVMLGWSMSKSLTSALIGLLVKSGKLTVDAPAPVPEWKGNEKEKITLKQLLQQTTGLSFRENYSGPSEVTNMLFKYGDMAAFTAKLPLKHEPGTVFNYSSGNSNILSRIVRHTVGEREYSSFPYRSFFHKIGMYHTMLEPDASGTFIGSSYSYATARDFARFGLLYYNNGNWNGEQIFHADWVKESIQPSAADKLKNYGYQFWLNGFNKADPSKRRYPDVPVDMFMADGYGGQGIYVIPSRKLVVVRLGLYVIDDNRLLKNIISTVPGG